MTRAPAAFAFLGEHLQWLEYGAHGCGRVDKCA